MVWSRTVECTLQPSYPSRTGRDAEEKQNLLFRAGATVMHQSTSKGWRFPAICPPHPLKPSQYLRSRAAEGNVRNCSFTGINSCSLTGPHTALPQRPYLIDGHVIYFFIFVHTGFVITLQIIEHFPGKKLNKQIRGKKQAHGIIYCLLYILKRKKISVGQERM